MQPENGALRRKGKMMSTASFTRFYRRSIAALLIASVALPATARTLVTERAVMTIRHGIRAPLDGEVPEGTRTAAPWPAWPVAQSRLTPHGLAALETLGRVDGDLWRGRGLIVAAGCPAPRSVRIWANNADRTIESGAAYLRGFAPGCDLSVGHRPRDEVDPLFEPMRVGATDFDAHAAVAAINRYTGGMAALAARHRAGFALLDKTLGCAPRAVGCVPAAAPLVRASGDGRGVDLIGPIRATSGVAQVLLLEYLEGLPPTSVGWGRADVATLRQLGALHAALFDVFTRSPYMAAHQSAVIGRDILKTLADPAGAKFTLFVGHDTTVTALAAALNVNLSAPGYAVNDVPPGGALLIEKLRDTDSGATFIRLSYRTQSPQELRHGGKAVKETPIVMPGCGARLCPEARFRQMLTMRLAQTTRESQSD